MTSFFGQGLDEPLSPIVTVHNPTVTRLPYRSYRSGYVLYITCTVTAYHTPSSSSLIQQGPRKWETTSVIRALGHSALKYRTCDANLVVGNS